MWISIISSRYGQKLDIRYFLRFILILDSIRSQRKFLSWSHDRRLESCYDYQLLSVNVFASLAQLVESLPCKQKVASSILAGGSTKNCMKNSIKNALKLLVGIVMVCCCTACDTVYETTPYYYGTSGPYYHSYLYPRHYYYTPRPRVYYIPPKPPKHHRPYGNGHHRPSGHRK